MPRRNSHLFSYQLTPGTTGVEVCGRNNIMSAFAIHEDALYSEVSNARKRIMHGHIALTDASNGSGQFDGVYSATASFIDLWETEISRIGDFLQAQQQNLEFSAKALLTNVAAAMNRIVEEEDSPRVTASEEEERTTTTNSFNGSQKALDVIQTWRYKTEELVDACLMLQRFAIQNKATLEEIGSYADEELNTACVASLKRRFSNAPWKTGPNSALIVVLSDVYEAIRTAEARRKEGGPKIDDRWIAPSSFERKTSKYWVHDDQLTDLLLTVVSEAPLLVYGKSGRLTSKAECLSQRSEGDKLWDQLATPISSVYFDSPSMALYKERLPRREGAQLLRVRWYGRMPRGNEPIFLELKTHHEKWINTKSVKERVTIREKDMVRFLDTSQAWTVRDAEEMALAASPTLDKAGLDKAADRLLRMRNLVAKHELSPCVRTCYLRAAFQSSESNALRLTIDRNITMIDETKNLSGSWCLPEDAVIQHTMAARVPFVVLEVKIAGDDVMPPVIQDLQQRGVIQEASKFSKFLTGASAFNMDKVGTLPYWASHPAFAAMFGASGAATTVQSLAVVDSNSKSDIGVDRNSDTTSNTSATEKMFESTHFFHPTKPVDGLRSSSVVSNIVQERTSRGRSSADRSEVDKSKVHKAISRRFGFRGLFRRRMRADEQQVLSIAPKRPARVEPKSYFANERTFIQWISAGLLLVTISVILLGIDSDMGTTTNYARKSGIGVCAGAVVIVFYATYIYFRRLRLLSTGSPYGYVDHMGPFVLAVSVCTGVVVLLTHFLGEIRRANYKPRAPVYLHEEPGKCYMHSNRGISKLEYQPSDIAIDTKRNTLMVPSLQRIVAHSLFEPQPNRDNPVKILVEIPNSNIEGLTVIGDRVFALSEGPKRTELIELYWNIDDELSILHRWKLGGAQQAEAIAYVPDKTRRSGRIFVDVNMQIHIYNVPQNDTVQSIPKQDEDQDDDDLLVVEESIEPDELDRIGSLNSHVLKAGLTELRIASMYYFEGIAYILHDNEMILRAWDLDEGDLLAEIPLPRIEGGFSKEWEGIALERREIMEGQHDPLLIPEHGSLRGSKEASSSSGSQLILHLALDTPAQVWSLAVEEGDTRGSLVLPSCAVSRHATDDSFSKDERSDSP